MSLPARDVITFPDARWNSWRWRSVLERWGNRRVFIDPNFLKTTAFLIENGQRIGTVFFVRVPVGKSPHSLFGEYVYAVTVNHNLESDISLSLRLPKKSGGFEDKEIPTEDWIRDRGKDVAVLPIEFPIGDYALRPIPIRHAVIDRDYLIAAGTEPIETDPAFRWGTGDEVFTVGLFDQELGQGSDRPVARFGRVALRPAESEKLLIEIADDTLVDADAFLVEMAGWPGQSGSPVFLRPWADTDRMSEERPHWEINFLLGIVQGFYNGGEQRVEINDTPCVLSGLNMGISVVLPARTFAEILRSPELIERREKLLSGKTRSKPPRRAVEGKGDR